MLTREEARQILVARNEKNEQQARALYDFEGETKRELNFSKVRHCSDAINSTKFMKKTVIAGNF